ncbi:MAG TPA: type II toxin-antitoxin system RelE/ParE family toxin [Terriglobia bacterium]|nr:type II toxin-antitoxin system RelE/ParE family toxin [Terriglobia bacterium]
MASYNILFKPSVEKDFSSLPKSILQRVIARIDSLAESPYPAGSMKLSGAEKLYRLRAGEYRIIYEVDAKAKKITVHYVRHRREVYRRL